MFQKIKEVDEGITYILTTLVWWIDVHFNKNNIWCAKGSFLYIPPAIIFFGGDFSKAMQEKVLLDFVLAGVLLSAIVFLLMSFFWDLLYDFSRTGERLLKQAQKSPNPNRYERIVVVRKVAFFMMWVFAVFRFQQFFLPSIFLSYLLSIYFLCVEGIPPEEKERRKKENETNQLLLAEN